MSKSELSGTRAVVTLQNGVPEIAKDSPLRRLNYFDGKFLRAADLQREQQYLRTLVQVSNQSGAPGVAYGYDLSLGSGDTLQIGCGLAFDASGRVILLCDLASVSISELIDASRQRLILSKSVRSGSSAFGDCVQMTESPTRNGSGAPDLYLLTVGYAEELCGTEDVYGKLCAEACVTSTDRPYWVEGVVVRVVPLVLTTPLIMSKVPLTQTHLRSRVASAYFQDERLWTASLISKAGLETAIWCAGADAAAGRDVPIGVLARAGSITVFLDAWTARRERIDAPAKRYWQWRMAMRPWDVFMAQVLQFQCQLHDLFDNLPAPTSKYNPCQTNYSLVQEAAGAMKDFTRFYKEVSANLEKIQVAPLTNGLAGLERLSEKLDNAPAINLSQNQVLIQGGIVELPSAGYLPVTPSSEVSVNEQVEQLMGDGVDLRFCIVRPDYVAHALEEAQHMERISLLTGLDDPTNKQQVDILVPNGQIAQQQTTKGLAYESKFNLKSVRVETTYLTGTAHIEFPSTGGFQIFLASWGLAVSAEEGQSPVRQFFAIPFTPAQQAGNTATTASPTGDGAALWTALSCGVNPFAATASGDASFQWRFVLVDEWGNHMDYLFNGTFRFDRPVVSGATVTVNGFFDGMASSNDGTTTYGGSGSCPVTAILDTSVEEAPTLSVTVLLSQRTGAKIEFRATWSGMPRTISAQLWINIWGWKYNFICLQNDDVLSPTNPLHSQALQAVDEVGSALKDTQFASRSATQLFPPPPPPTEDLEVLATLDWVLFQRRRTKKCQLDIVAPVVPNRRYQLWLGVVQGDHLPETIDALRNNTKLNPEWVFFTKVDLPEFASGVPTLITAASTIATDWKNQNPGQQLVYAGIASTDAAKQDGATLALGRLKQVDQAVATVSQPTSDAITEVLDNINPDLAVPDVDGIIVLLTMVPTVCHSVFIVDYNADLDAVKQLILDGQIASVFIRGDATPVGNVTFRLKTAEVQDDSLTSVVTAWQQLVGAATGGNAVTVSLQGDAADLVASRVDQAKAILEALGAGSNPSLVAILSPGAWDSKLVSSCPALTFVVSNKII